MVMVLVVMESSWKCQWSFVVDRPRNPQMSGLRPAHNRRGLELVATEETGTGMRGQHCQMTPRANQALQPADRQMRIGGKRSHTLIITRASLGADVTSGHGV